MEPTSTEGARAPVVVAEDEDEDGATDEEIPSEVMSSLAEAPEAIEEIITARDTSGFLASPLVLGATVALLSFVVEEIAIAASAYLAGSGRLTEAMAFFSLYAGIFLSDLFLYALGLAVARNRWVRSYVDIEFYQAQARRHLAKGLWSAIVIARLVPGMLIPVFIGLGAARCDLRKVAAVNLVVTGVYSFVVLTLLLKTGTHLSAIFGPHTGLVVIALVLLYLYRGPIATYARLHLLGRARSAPRWPHGESFPPPGTPRALTWFEALPGWIVYAPVAAMLVLLCLRHRSLAALGLVNPGIELSGLFGESKAKVLGSIPPPYRELVPRYVVVEGRADLASVLRTIEAAGLQLPLVAKPDVGYMSRGVELVPSEDALAQLLADYPEGQALLLQRYVPGGGEAGVFYAARPSAPEDAVISVALTIQPFVVGDGRRSLAGLVAADPRFAYFADRFDLRDHERVPAPGEVARLKLTGSTSDGCLHLRLDVPEDAPLRRTIAAVSAAMPELWLGRYDVKFESIADLLAGRFVILEVNGAGGEDLAAWDPRSSPLRAYAILWRQLRSMFAIGVENAQRGFAPASLGSFLKGLLLQESLLFRLALARANARPRPRAEAAPAKDDWAKGA